MTKEFIIEAKKLKNIVLFNPEIGHNGSTSTENSIFLKVENQKLLFEILSFRYILTGYETIDSAISTEMILPLKRLQDIIRSFADDVKLLFKEKDNTTISVEANSITFNIKTCEQEQRNQIDTNKGEEYSISKNELLDGIKKVKIAMGDDEVRYYLNGIHIEIYKDNDNLYHPFLVATNGHVLATFGDKKDEWQFVHKAIMPKKVISEIIKILERTENNVLISFNKSNMNIKSDNLEILIEADFPDYNKVIPYNNSKEITIETSALKDAVEKVSIVSNDKNKNAKLLIADNNISVEMISSDGNSANANITTAYTGKQIEVILNAKYLIDVLAQVEEEKIVFKIEDGISPLIIQEEQNKKLLVVIMPIRS